jgi:hypothetical protein
MFRIKALAPCLLLAAFMPAWTPAAACPAFTSLDQTLLEPPAAVTPGGNPEHYREWVYQEFPSFDLQHVNSVSAWSVQVVQHTVDPTSGTQILAIGEAIYTTSEGKRVKALDALWPQQIIVPYAGSRDVIHDLFDEQPLMSLTEREAALAPCGAAGPGIYPRVESAAENDRESVGSLRSIYVKEIRDTGIATANFNGYDGYVPPRPRMMRRGRELVIWGISDAHNYNNIIAYHFRDDGEVTALLGPSGWNTASGPPGRMQSGNTPHAHTALWRVQPTVVDGPSNSVAVVRYDQRDERDGTATEMFVAEPMAGEATLTYDARELTRVLIYDSSESGAADGSGHGHLARRPGYALSLVTDGTPRHRMWEEDDHSRPAYDFAVVRSRASEQDAQPFPDSDTEEVLDLVDGEQIASGPVAIYAFSTIAHIPRTEDFIVHPGSPEYDKPHASVNRTAARWSGVRLTPRNLHAQIPFSRATPGVAATPLRPQPLTPACVSQASPPWVEELACEGGLRRYSIGLLPTNQNPFGKAATAIEITGADLAQSPVRITTRLPYGEGLATNRGQVVVRPRAGQDEVCLGIAMAGENWRCPAEIQCIEVAGAACEPSD